MIRHTLSLCSALVIAILFAAPCISQDGQDADQEQRIPYPTTGHPIISPEFVPRLNADLHRHLDQTVDLDYFDAPMKDVIDDIRSRYNTRILLDESAVENGLTTTTLVTFTLKDVTLREALDRLTAQHNCTWSLDGDGIMLVDRQEAYAHMEVQIFDCRELLATADGGGTDSVEKLKNVIRSSVEPWSWEGNGGRATVSEFGGLVVVLQRSSFQKSVENLLREMQARLDDGK